MIDQETTKADIEIKNNNLYAKQGYVLTAVDIDIINKHLAKSKTDLTINMLETTLGGLQTQIKQALRLIKGNIK